MAQYIHTTGTQIKTKSDPKYDISIVVARGKTIINRQTGRKRIVDRKIETLAHDPNDISMELEFVYDGQLWRVDEDNCEVIE